VFEDMYIPWTPRLRRRTPEPEPTHPEAKPEVCPQTLHIARAIVAYATAPFPEIAATISAAFVAYIRGRLTIHRQGAPSTWIAIPIPDGGAT
jgi:hypothetical protein